MRVHRAAERQDRVVAGRVGGRLRVLRDFPCVEFGAGCEDALGEDAGAGAGLVDDRERAQSGRLLVGVGEPALQHDRSILTLTGGR